MNNDQRIPPAPPPLPRTRREPMRAPGAPYGILGLIIVIFVFFLLPIWFWFFCRIEPGSDEMAILIRKTGGNLPSGQILAMQEGQKGIQLDVLSEGRYFRNPYTWGWKIEPIIDVPAGKLGVRTRLFGDELPDGHIIASETSKGILPDVLSPGKYRVNPYAYNVQMYDAIEIRPGHVGVVTVLTGRDILNGEIPKEQRNVYLVGEKMKGVQAKVLDPGTYYLNPYMFNVVEVNLQSQRFEMSGDDSINFLTADGFTVTVEGTLEYALMRDKVALLTHEVGDMDDILKKIVLPRARGFSRIEGSKQPAKNYITGTTRQQFQDSLEAHLQKICQTWGIDIRSVLIRNISPPDEIASIIRDREVAVQTAKKFEQQIEQAKSKAELTRQEMLAQQNKEKVDAETVKIRAVILAQQEQSVRVTQANREFEVATIDNEASVPQSEAMLLKGNADKEVIRMRNEADATVMASQIAAFGNGTNFARNAFFQKVGPQVTSVLSGDDPQGLGGLFLPYIPAERKAVQR